MSMNINTNMMTAYFPKAGYKMGIEKKKLSGTKDAEHTFAEAQKTQNAGGGFVLHISNEQDGEAIGAMCGADHSVTVYKPKDFDAANPVYKVKIWDEDGNATERMVDVSKVDPRNSDYIDMFAYSSHLTATGKCPNAQSAFTSSAMNQHGMDETSYQDLFQQRNWVNQLADAMQTQYAAGNIEGYLRYKPFWDFLTKKEELMQSVEQQVQRNQGKKLPLEEIKKCSSSMDNDIFDDEEQVTISAEEGLQTWYEGRTLAEWALTDPQYTDSETGFSWYVRDGKHPYMVGKDAEKFKEMCQETGESWLKKFAEMTGMIQYLDDNTVAYVGTNGIAVKSKDGKELSVDTSSLTYDMIQSLLQNMRGGGNYFDSQHWQEAIQKIKYNAVS